MYYYENNSGRIAKEISSHFYYGTDKRLFLLEFQDTKEIFIISDKHLKAYFAKEIIQYSKSNKAIDWIKRIENKNLQLIFVNEKIKSDLVIIDSNIVWYGEIPIFGKQYNCDNSLLRLESPEIAKEFLANH